VDLTGKTCIVLPISWQHPAERSMTVDMWGVRGTLLDALATKLTKAGLTLVTPGPGTRPVSGLVVRWELVRADPGSRAVRYEWGPFAGAAVVEVEGQIFDSAVPLGHFYAQGTRRHSWFFGGNSESLLRDAAKLAGRRAAEQILDYLKAR
jgi:hypothetical protein